MLFSFDTGSVCFPRAALPFVKVVPLTTLEVALFIAFKVVAFIVASGCLPFLSWPSPVCFLLDFKAASAHVALVVISLIFALLENSDSPSPPFNRSTKGQHAELEMRRWALSTALMTSQKLDPLGMLPPSFAEQLHMSMNTKREYKTANPTLAMVESGSPPPVHMKLTA
jgi:hypothetical protein